MGYEMIENCCICLEPKENIETCKKYFRCNCNVNICHDCQIEIDKCPICKKKEVLRKVYIQILPNCITKSHFIKLIKRYPEYAKKHKNSLIKKIINYNKIEFIDAIFEYDIITFEEFINEVIITPEKREMKIFGRTSLIGENEKRFKSEFIEKYTY